MEDDHATPDEDTLTGFKFETNLIEQFKTETLLPSDDPDDEAKAAPALAIKHVSNLKPAAPPTVRCTCGGVRTWIDDIWRCDSCGPPRARPVTSERAVRS
jgi:hypothetical protein